MHSVQIGEIAEVFNGKTPSKKEKRDAGHPVLKIKDVTLLGNFCGSFENFVEQDLAARHSKRWIEAEDTLILNAAHNASHVASKIYLAEPDVSGALPVGEWTVVRPRREDVEPSLLYWWLQGPNGRSALKDAATGLHLYPKDVARIEIPLPPIEEQRRIVDILNRAASIERLKARASAHLRDFIPALFLKMFGDRDEIANRYPIVMLKELSDIGSGVTKGRKLNNAELVDVPYLRVANVQDGYLDLGEVKMIPIRETERDKYGLQVGDLVLTEGGDPDKLGRGALWQGELPYCAHQNHVFRVRPDIAMVLGPYLKEVVGSAYGKAYFLSVAKQTTGIASINKTQLGQFPVPVPPMELQAEFTKLVEAAQARARLAEKADSLATDLSRSLLDKLLGTHGSQSIEHGEAVTDPVLF